MAQPMVAGVILAGGQGSRLGGVTKANLKIGRQRLLDRVAAALADQTDIIGVAIGHLPETALRGGENLGRFADAPGADAGPVNGLAAALSWCSATLPECTFLLSAAVDTPFFPRDFVARALHLLDAGTDVVIGQRHGQAYPTNALWRLSALADLPARLAQGRPPNGLKAVAPADRCRYLSYDDAPHDVFAGVNTVADLIARGRIAYHQTDGRTPN